MSRGLFVLAAIIFSSATLADEAAIRRVLESKFGIRVEGVQAAPISGLYEVRVRSARGPEILYSDAQADYVLSGAEIIHTPTGRNLTEERLRKLSAIDFKTLPLQQAIKIRRGNGKRVLAMFTDPYCPYCRRFEMVLQQVSDITVYVFMFPVIQPAKIDHSRAVWCSKDRVAAWLDLAARDVAKIPAARPDCPNPVDEILKFGQSIGVNSTPTLFFANGERVSGGLKIEDLVKMLDAAGVQTDAKSRAN
ncbi:MAG: DsbC family protein [Betaproteobacteria bacterium]|nr:DsbC family protein [Betaproteobacteria bacterium]